MNKKIFIALYLAIITLSMNAQDSTRYNKLTPEEEFVILHKGTEAPYSGEYYYNKAEGTYLCKRCNAPLYRSSDKFDAQCGWPSFDDEIEGAVLRKTDADGRRTEILCANCGAHLGHVFTGEGFTDKNTRHCVNSISLTFQPLQMPGRNQKQEREAKSDTAIFAGGCFWGMQYYFEDKKGVLSTQVGYIGGHTEHPTYEQVCSHTTGHIEAIEVVFNPQKISYEELAKLFFEIHDPTQVNRQGPDIGEQYKSAIFYRNEEQKEIAEKLIKILKSKGYDVVTELIPATEFWPAEDYHQQYYERNGHRPYCHFYQKKF
jgi:peptide methionine sulfoxide reductase msrA/msrB